MEKHRKKKVTKKTRIRKNLSEETPMMTQVGTLVYFAQEEYYKLVLQSSSDGWRSNWELAAKLNPNLYCLCTDTVTTIVEKVNVPSDAVCSIPEACCSRKKSYWHSA